MSFRSLFINEDAPVKHSDTSAQNTPYIDATVVAAATPATGDETIRQMLLQSMQDSKLAGFDYLKFIAAFNDMASLGGREGDHFKAAYMAAKQFGVDKAKLTESAQHYLSVLERDAKDFAGNLEAKTKETVGVSAARISEIEKTVADYNVKIQKMKTAMEGLKTEHENLLTRVAADKAKLDNKKAAFDTTHAGLSNEIQMNIQKINKYL